MGWFALARVLFAAIVAYAAAILHPLSLGLRRQHRVRAGAGRAGRALRVPSAPDRDHARPGRAARLRRRPADRARDRGRHLLGRSGRPAGRLPRQLHSDRAAVSGPGGRRQARRVARAGAPGRPVPRRRTRAALQDSRHERHHRRPHRRRLRNGLHRRHHRHPAVRAQGAAVRRRLLRFAQAQPRPARARHPAADQEDGRASRSRFRTSIFRTSTKSI